MIVNKINLHSVLEPTSNGERKGLLIVIGNGIRSFTKRVFAQPDMTFEQWEQLERKHSPHSSHHAQIYFRERGI